MLATLPPDILEHIAYYASTHTLLGPPSDLVPLLTLCRTMNATLGRLSNPHLYARIFAAKFDLAAPRRRLAHLYGLDARSVLSVNTLADELVRRFVVLKRLRAELDARSPESSGENISRGQTAYVEADARLDELLWTAFLMVLEDAGRNTAQLRNARIEGWLAVFWFDAQGASEAIRRLSGDLWPVAPAYSKDLVLKTRHALGMWLFWFFLNPAAYVANPDLYRRAERILKLVSLNAPLYPLSHLPWTSFRPEPIRIHFGLPGVSSTEPLDPQTVARTHSQQPASGTPSQFLYFGRQLPPLTPPLPAVPANLALLALHARSRRNADTLEGGLELLELLGPSLAEPFIALPEQVPNVDSERMRNSLDVGVEDERDASLQDNTQRWEGSKEYPDSYRWEYEWLRCVSTIDRCASSTGMPGPDSVLRRPNTRKYEAYQSGILDGSWEGPFTYTEFHSFANLLAGAWPSKLQDILVAQHNQTWRLREYHLLASPSSQTRYTAPSVSELNGTTEDPVPLPVGDAILAHIPDGVAIRFDHSTLTLTLPSSFSPPPSVPSVNSEPLPRVYTYTRCRGHSSSEPNGGSNGQSADDEEDEESYASRVVDILLSGEGHSGWGEFRILGRVRPVDGFISIMKEYTGSDRGRWLYRGYLIGAGTAPSGRRSVSGADSREDAEESKGYIVGRWRDMLTAAETHGYEGAFAMARRR
ncbi:hypothetical protein ACEPAF_9036 [Sanghuangporus sanghuang]